MDEANHASRRPLCASAGPDLKIMETKMTTTAIVTAIGSELPFAVFLLTVYHRLVRARGLGERELLGCAHPTFRRGRQSPQQLGDSLFVEIGHHAP